MVGSPSINVSALRKYCEARRKFLRDIGCDGSCRDPLAEFAEKFACEQLQATLAKSRVQKGYDLIKDGRRIQVKYLANPSGAWRNEHAIALAPDVHDYVLLVFENLELRAFLKFSCEDLKQVCAALGKRHPDQHATLQLTQANVRALLRDRDRYVALAVTCFSYADAVEP